MNITTLQGATVLITGGTGTFGNAFLDECLAAGADEIRSFLEFFRIDFYTGYL